MATLAIGLTIEGLGRTATANLFTEPLRLSDDAGVMLSPGRLYYPALSSWPSQVETTLDIRTGMVDQSSVAFNITGLDLADDEAADLRNFFLLSRPERKFKLRDSYSKTQTSMMVQSFPGVSAPSSNEVLWIGREAMRVDSVGGVSPNWTIGVTRSIFGTSAQDLVESRDFFYRTSPNAKDRLVTIYVVDLEDDTSETVVWRGVLESADLDGPLINVQINAVDILSYISDQPLGSGRSTGILRVKRSEDSAGGAIISAIPGGGMSARDYIGDVYRVGFYAIGETLARASNRDSINTDIQGNETFRPMSSTGQSYTSFGDVKISEFVSENINDFPAGSGVGADAAEVILADTSDGLSWFRDGQGTTAEDAQTSHVLDIMRAIMASTGETTYDVAGFPTNPHRIGPNGDFDCLPGAWGLSFPDEFFDHLTFDKVKSTYPYSLLVAQNFVLGTPPGKDLERAVEVIKRLAIAAGGYLYQTGDGRVAFGSLTAPTLANVDAVIGETELDPDGLKEVEIRTADLGPVQRITVNLNRQGLSDAFQFKFTGRDFSGELEERYKRQTKTDTIDGGHYGDPRSGTVSPELLGAVAGAMERRFVLLADGLPQYTIKLQLDAKSVLAGQWIALSHPAIPDPRDGSRGITNHRCLVVTSSRDLPTAHINDADDVTAGQTLTVINYQPVTLAEDVCAPSWLVSDVTSNKDFTVKEDFFGGDGLTREDVDLWRNASDGSFFVDLWTRDGVLRSTDGPSTGNIVGDAVTLTTEWTAAAAGILPVAGDVIRVANYDASGEWPNEDYAWIGDLDATIGAGGDPAPRWDV